MINFEKKSISEASKWLEWVIFGLSGITLLYWLTGTGLFYSETSPVLSPFTSLSLALMIVPRIAVRYTDTWSQPMTLSLLGIVTCGNASSLIVQLLTPDLFLAAMPSVVPTSAITSTGIMLLGSYEILVVLRKTPRSAFILDDILLHLALFPGALSLLGFISGVSIYTSSAIDPRAGVSFLEIFLMFSFVTVALINNPHLFLWQFLAKNPINRTIFFILFLNQYVASFAYGIFLRSSELAPDKIGVEFFIMVAGVLATLLFLTVNAFNKDFRRQ